MKECFSFIRWSNSKQSLGNSDERQNEIAPRVAKEKGWILREDLKIQLEGVSSWKGNNKGALLGVAQAAKEGKIAQGTVMILEAIDRASRFSVDEGREIIRQILLSGVEIYNDQTKKILTKASLNNLIDLLELLFQLDAAFKYSDLLSERVSKAWLKKRQDLEQGERLTKKTVAWVNPETWKPIPEKAKVVKEIFEMYANNFGISEIVKKLNGNKTPCLGIGKVWNTGYIHSLLKSRAVIGEFQPHKTYRKEGIKSYKRQKSGVPIKNYYPPIIENALFYTVQEKLSANKIDYRKTGEIKNLFAGKAYCECGEKMYLAGGKGGRFYYYCRANILGTGCKSPSILYRPIEDFFLSYLSANFSKILPTPKQENKKLIELRGEVLAMEEQVKNITGYVLKGLANEALVTEQGRLLKELEPMREQLQRLEVKAIQNTEAPSIDFTTVSFEDLKNNMNVRRFMRDFIIQHVAQMEFSLDRKKLKIGFNNDTHKEMLQDFLK